MMESLSRIFVTSTIITYNRFHAHRYTPIKPVKFQIGDIVKAQVSIVAFPIRDKKMKTVMILRGLTLLDGKFSQVRFL